MPCDSDSPRRGRCVECDGFFLVCRFCDGGTKYCSDVCRGSARNRQVRAAGRRYEATARGREANAARQRRHRERQSTGVTHQGAGIGPDSQAEQVENPTLAPTDGIAPAAEATAGPNTRAQATEASTCITCGREVGLLVRLRPLSWTRPLLRRSVSRHRRAGTRAR